MSQYTKQPGEILTLTIPFNFRLNSCELLTGTPTVQEVGTSDLTISNATLNALPTNCAPWWLTTFPWQNGPSVPANQAVQFTVAGGTARTAYTVRITVSTDGSPAQTFVENIRVQVT